MVYHIGRYCFPSKEYYEQLLKTNIIKEYDTSPYARQKHDEEAIFNTKGEKIKLTDKERWEYWRRILNYTKPKKVIKIADT